MKELIVVGQSKFGEAEIQTVNARDLHSSLGVRKDFSNWIKKQIERARLIENRDFVTVTLKGVGGKFDTIEYHLSLEAGKHIAMLSGTDKGFEVREYFLECERQVQAPKALPQNYKEALVQLIEQVEANEQLQLTIAEQSPKVEALDRISTADGLMNITNAAKALQLHPNSKLFVYLSSHGWIYRRMGGKGWGAYQNRIQQGLLSHKVTTVSTSDGREKIVEQVLVTSKGLAKLADAFRA